MPKVNAGCSWCGKDGLLRWPTHPVTKKPIQNFFCDKQCKGKWQTAKRESLGFTREWLTDQYITQGKGANQIGREIGRDGKRVWEWLRDYGIPTRTRGHDTSQLPKDGSSFRGKKHSEEAKKKFSEIAKADGRRPWGKGDIPYWKGKTGEQHPAFKGGLTPERQSVYSSQEWVEAVKAVWKRDNAICQRCWKSHNETEVRGTFHIHHIVSFQVKSLQTEPSNLVLLCNECHKFVHGKNNIDRLFIKDHNND